MLLLCLEFGCTELDQHFVADASDSGVFKTRSVKHHPPSRQADLALLQSISARPWDPTGSKAETDTFVFPQAKRSEEATVQGPSNFDEQQEQQQSTEPLAPGDLQEVEDLLGDDLSGFEPEAFRQGTTFRTWSLWRPHLILIRTLSLHISLWTNRHKANQGLQVKQLCRTQRLQGLDLRRRLLLLRPNGHRRLCLLVPPRCREWRA